MDRKDDRQPPADRSQRAEQLVEHVGVVDVGGAMQGEDRERAAGQAQPLDDRRGAPAHPRRQQGVGHDVADEVDLLRCGAFAQEVGAGSLLGDEQDVGHGVGEHAVDLFRHRAIEAAQAGLDVDDRDAELHGGEGGGQRGVHVADDQHGIGARRRQHGLQAPHHLGGLHGVRAGADLQVVVGDRQVEVAEELPGHRLVVVLTGVHQRRRDGGMAPHLPQQRADLDEVGARPHDVDDLHGPRPPTASPRGRPALPAARWRSAYRPRAAPRPRPAGSRTRRGRSG